MSKNKYRYTTGLSRPIDVNYPTNRWILIFTVVAGFIGFAVGLIAGDGFFTGVWMAIHAGAATFPAWVLAREIDPDHDYSAFVGAGIALVAALVLNAHINLIAITVLVYILRVVNRTSGVRYSLYDAGLLVILAAWVGTGSFWMLGVMLALSILLDASLPDGHWHGRAIAGIVFLTTLISAAVNGAVKWDFALTGSDIVIVVLVVALMRVFIPSLPAEMRSVGDFSGKPLDRRRVMYGATLAALTVIVVSWSGGDSVINGVLPLPASIAGVVLYQGWLTISAARQ